MRFGKLSTLKLKFKYMPEDYRPKTMAEGDKKRSQIFSIVLSVIIIVIFFATYVFDNFLSRIQERATGIWDILSIGCFIASLAVLWYGWIRTNKDGGGANYPLFSILLLLAAILFSSGFNFDLKGIE